MSVSTGKEGLSTARALLRSGQRIDLTSCHLLAGVTFPPFGLRNVLLVLFTLGLLGLALVTGEPTIHPLWLAVAGAVLFVWRRIARPMTFTVLSLAGFLAVVLLLN